MEATSLLKLLFVMTLLFHSTDQTRLILSPSSLQAFTWKSLALSCEDGWMVKRNTSTESRIPCGISWGRWAGSTCTISVTVTWDSGVYWCESREGAMSNSVQLTVTDKPVILQSPVHPVIQGDSITLHCKTKMSDTLSADFYKDNILIGSGSASHMTIHHVSKSAQGLYRCHIKGHGESLPSRVIITGDDYRTTGDDNRTTGDDNRTTGDAAPTGAAPNLALLTPTAVPLTMAPPPAWLPLQTVIILLLHLVKFSPYFASTFLLVLLFRRRSSGKDRPVSVVTQMPKYAVVGLDDIYGNVVPLKHHV
ncbi:uncharacterized protein LOC121504410 isoform X1 [Cheilinus undulatus]|uniref:uncharacterized protein LOC121504410 isoform X1 n=1 Tax=Cheilinus undulatus TaxID=241271 RepID=UPI001BD3F790|nr:uncharacterized protein LOC121504410 isoform X1 [Cheilinus undulatus]